MAVILRKQQSISLEKTTGGLLQKISLGLGWDPVKAGLFAKLAGGTGSVDLDASCILLDNNLTAVDLVCFRQLRSQDGSIQHSGDNRTGEGAGDDETITIDLQRLSTSVQHLVFTINSIAGQNFDKIENAYCRVVNQDNRVELARFNLSDRGHHTGIVMANLSRGNGEWQFKAIGKTTHGRSADELVSLAVQALS